MKHLVKLETRSDEKEEELLRHRDDRRDAEVVLIEHRDCALRHSAEPTVRLFPRGLDVFFQGDAFLSAILSAILSCPPQRPRNRLETSTFDNSFDIIRGNPTNTLKVNNVKSQ